MPSTSPRSSPSRMAAAAGPRRHGFSLATEPALWLYARCCPPITRDGAGRTVHPLWDNSDPACHAINDFDRCYYESAGTRSRPSIPIGKVVGDKLSIALLGSLLDSQSQLHMVRVFQKYCSGHSLLLSAGSEEPKEREHVADRGVGHARRIKAKDRGSWVARTETDILSSGIARSPAQHDRGHPENHEPFVHCCSPSVSSRAWECRGRDYCARKGTLRITGLDQHRSTTLDPAPAGRQLDVSRRAISMIRTTIQCFLFMPLLEHPGTEVAEGRMSSLSVVSMPQYRSAKPRNPRLLSPTDVVSTCPDENVCWLTPTPSTHAVLLPLSARGGSLAAMIRRPRDCCQACSVLTARLQRFDPRLSTWCA
jgi:hypothetical protein